MRHSYKLVLGLLVDICIFSSALSACTLKDNVLDKIDDIITKPTSSNNAPTIATVTDIWVAYGGDPFATLYGKKTSAFNLVVKLKPTKVAKANVVYIVNLYEKGKIRDTNTPVFVMWNQPELNVLKHRLIMFPITRTEYEAYFMKDISHIFSAKVYE